MAARHRAKPRPPPPRPARRERKASTTPSGRHFRYLAALVPLMIMGLAISAGLQRGQVRLPSARNVPNAPVVETRRAPEADIVPGGLLQDGQRILSGRNAKNATNAEPTLLRRSAGTNPQMTETPLNDASIRWDPTVRREWLYPDASVSGQSPPAMLLLTTLGWNQPDQKEGLKLSRYKRETELIEGVVDHPWFHPTAWTDIEERNGTVRQDISYYVFLDFPQCLENYYPFYMGFKLNLDVRLNRATGLTKPGEVVPIDGISPARDAHVRSIFRSRLFRESRNAKVVLFDCYGWGPPPSFRNRTQSDAPVALVSISALISLADETTDQGLVPAPPRPARLSPSQVADIASCEAETNRKFHVVYLGNTRSGQNENFHKRYGKAREDYFEFHDDNRTFVLKKQTFGRSILSNYTYEEILSRTVFGLAPRGDKKYSFRFSEVLSAGAIPVVHADDWVWPFRPELIDWNECAVILPERDSGRVGLDVLDGISVERRCRMRQRCYEIYKKYVETPTGTIRGIIEGLELLAAGKRKPMAGVRCNTTHPDPSCNCNAIGKSHKEMKFFC